ncbi:hypothetical protein N0V88_006852 [Collariella sp. IMI 366227]|nr:hypothetical protein N0V88_006852 [Collariella sp. IMI 366227]
MESRVATKLGENIKLFRVVSIFFLLLGLCMASWSINESYSRTHLLIVTVIGAVATCSVTLNLNTSWAASESFTCRVTAP